MCKKSTLVNVNAVRAHMRKNIFSCRDNRTGEVNHTLLAEMTAADLNLYFGPEEDIPEQVFEIALEFN